MAERRAVADTSVLIALEELDLLEKLSLFYGTVLVPAGVRGEFLRGEEKLASPEPSKSLTTLIEQPPFAPCDDYDTAKVMILLERLDSGEAEALAQCDARAPDDLLMDDARGRRLAEQAGHRPVGTQFLVARFHVMGIVTDYEASWRHLQSVGKLRTTAAVARSALDRARNG